MAHPYRTPFFLIILGATSILAFWLIMPYLSAILTSLVAAMLLHPLYQRIKRITHLNSTLSTTLTAITAFLIVIIPLVSLISTLASQTYHFQQSLAISYNRENIEQISQRLNDYLATLPIGDFQIDTDAVYSTIQSTVKSLGNWFFSSAIALTNSTVIFFTNLIIVIILTISLLPNLDKIKRYVVRLSPLDKHTTQRYLRTGQDMMNNMIKGTFLVAFIQATLAGIVLWLFDVPVALLLTIVMTILAIIPYMGTAFVMFPTAAYFYLSGNTFAGTVILLHQVLLVGTIDNILRPILLSGTQAKLHPAIMLLAILGGMKMFGPFLGLMYGPVITILFLTTLDIYQESHQ